MIEYATILNVSDAIHSIKGHCKNYEAVIKTKVFRTLSNISDKAFCKKNNA